MSDEYNGSQTGGVCGRPPTADDSDFGGAHAPLGTFPDPTSRGRSAPTHTDAHSDEPPLGIQWDSFVYGLAGCGCISILLILLLNLINR